MRKQQQKKGKGDKSGISANLNPVKSIQNVLMSEMTSYQVRNAIIYLLMIYLFDNVI